MTWLMMILVNKLSLSWVSWVSWRCCRGRKRAPMPAVVGVVALCLYACARARIKKIMAQYKKAKISRTIPPHDCHDTPDSARPPRSVAVVGGFFVPRHPRQGAFFTYFLLKNDDVVVQKRQTAGIQSKLMSMTYENLSAKSDTY